MYDFLIIQKILSYLNDVINEGSTIDGVISIFKIRVIKP